MFSLGKTFPYFLLLGFSRDFKWKTWVEKCFPSLCKYGAPLKNEANRYPSAFPQVLLLENHKLLLIPSKALIDPILSFKF